MNITHFDIVDRKTGLVVGQAKTRARATSSVDKRDLAYGGCRYFARAVYGAVQS